MTNLTSQLREKWVLFFGLVAICSVIVGGIYVALTLAVLWWTGLLDVLQCQ